MVRIHTLDNHDTCECVEKGRFLLSSVQRFINEDKLPHLLFYGPPGTGKTSTILACARQLYKDKEFNSMVLEVRRSSVSAVCEASFLRHCTLNLVFLKCS